jgi:hypothetical protein
MMNRMLGRDVLAPRPVVGRLAGDSTAANTITRLLMFMGAAYPGSRIGKALFG